MQIKSVKLKTNVRGLDVIQAVYAFAVALGLTQVFTGSQSFLTKVLSGAEGLTTEATVLVALLLANVVMLGLRFFWAPRNLQGLVITNARLFAMTPGHDRPSGALPDYVIAFHLVVILLHGALFFLICGEFEFVVFAVSSSSLIDASVFGSYIVMHAALLLMNAAWIALIRREEQRLELHLDAQMRVSEKPSAGTVWWRNNLLSSLIALAPFAIAATCKSTAAACVQQSLATGDGPIALFPTSPQVFSQVYYDIAQGLEYLGPASLYLAVYWVFVVFLVNSVYDLLRAGRFYVFFEDVEWETTIEHPNLKTPLER